MRLTSSILSLLIHLLVFVFVIYSSVGERHIDIELDKPVYQVDLVKLPPGESKSNKQEISTASKQPTFQKKRIDVPAPKEAFPSKKKSANQEPVKVAKKHTSKPKPAKAQKKKTPPAKKSKVKKPSNQLSQEKILAQALTELKDSSVKKKETNQDILDKELASLKQVVDQDRNVQGSSKKGSGFNIGEIYGRLVEQRVKANWRYPTQIGAQNNLQAEVQLRVDNQGNITKMKLVRKSGRADFDSSVLRAVEETDMLPPPPIKELNTIKITFNLQE